MNEIRTAVKAGTRADQIYELGAWMDRKLVNASLAGCRVPRIRASK